jgi:hypothetical protein
LSAGDAAQRAALSNRLEQLEYEAKKAFEQYNAVDARHRLVAGELERGCYLPPKRNASFDG